MYFVTARKEAK